MRSWLAISIVMLSLLGGCAAAPREYDDLSVRFDDDDWKAGYADEDRNYRVTEFIRKQAHMDDWSEKVRIERFPRRPSAGPLSDIFAMTKAERERECPAATDWRLVEQSAASLTYEAHSRTC